MNYEDIAGISKIKLEISQYCHRNVSGEILLRLFMLKTVMYLILSWIEVKISDRLTFKVKYGVLL